MDDTTCPFTTTQKLRNNEKDGLIMIFTTKFILEYEFTCVNE